MSLRFGLVSDASSVHESADRVFLIFLHPSREIGDVRGVQRAIRSRPLGPGEVEQIVRTHQAGIWRYLCFLGCDSAEADDLTQETFLAVMGRPLADLGPAPTRGYLRKVALTEFLKARKRQRIRTGLGDSEMAERACDLFCGDDGGDRYLASLRACLKILAPRVHEALDLRYGENLSRKNVANRLGLTEDGVKSLLSRGLARLRACVERRQLDEDA